MYFKFKIKKDVDPGQIIDTLFILSIFRNVIKVYRYTNDKFLFALEFSEYEKRPSELPVKIKSLKKFITSSSFISHSYLPVKELDGVWFDVTNAIYDHRFTEEYKVFKKTDDSSLKETLRVTKFLLELRNCRKITKDQFLQAYFQSNKEKELETTLPSQKDREKIMMGDWSNEKPKSSNDLYVVYQNDDYTVLWNGELHFIYINDLKEKVHYTFKLHNNDDYSFFHYLRLNRKFAVHIEIKKNNSNYFLTIICGSKGFEGEVKKYNWIKEINAIDEPLSEIYSNDNYRIFCDNYTSNVWFVDRKNDEYYKIKPVNKNKAKVLNLIKDGFYVNEGVEITKWGKIDGIGGMAFCVIVNTGKEKAFAFYYVVKPN